LTFAELGGQRKQGRWGDTNKTVNRRHSLDLVREELFKPAFRVSGRSAQQFLEKGPDTHGAAANRPSRACKHCVAP